MNTPLSKRLKKLRLGVGLTQKQLGEALHLSNLYKSPPGKIVADYESGLRIPTKEVISGYANYFMLHPNHLETLRRKSIEQRQEKRLKGCKTALSRILKKARLDAGLTMKETALKLRLGDLYPPIARNPGAVKARMSFWEAGRRCPAEEVLRRYTDVFGISVPVDEKTEVSVNGGGMPHLQDEVSEIALPPQTLPAASRHNGNRELQSSSENRASAGFQPADGNGLAHKQRDAQRSGEARSLLGDPPPSPRFSEETIYYHCTRRSRCGMPIEITRHYYDADGELIRIESVSVSCPEESRRVLHAN